MSDMLTDIGRTPERPLRSATVLSASNGRAKIELATGSVIPDALLVGGVSVGQSVRVAYQGGQYIVYGSAAEVAPSVSVAGTISGGTSAGGAPTPHDWLGIHHTLPTGAAGLFAATPSGSSGTVSMRGIVLSDIQAAADSRYSLASRTITAGAGLTGGGDLTASRTLNVGQGDGIAVDADAVRVRRATTSGLSFSSGGLQIDDTIAGNGLTIASKVLAVGAGNGISVASTSVAVNQAYAFTWSAAHTFSARPTFSAGATISAGQTLRFGADVDLQRKAANILSLASGDNMESTTFQSGVSGWQITSAGDAEFNNVRVRGELSASVFTLNEIAASAGTLGVFKSAGVVWSDFTTPSAVGNSGTLLAKNSDAAAPLFAVGDRLEIKAWTGTAIVDIWLEITARTNNTTHTSYSVTLRSGSTGVVIPAGVAIADWGPSGSGAVTLSADGTIGASANLSVQSHTGSPWSARTLHLRLGNLNGSYGYNTAVYGFAAGDSATTFVAVDATNGFRVRNGSANRFTVDLSGNVALRDASGTQRVGLTSAGVVEIDDSNGQARVLIDSGGLKLRDSNGNAAITLDASGNSQFTGVMNIASTGEIRQGTGDPLASPATYTGLRIWAETSGGNLFGRIAGYSSGIVQWYAGTDGKLYAGGGVVSLSQSGATVLSSNTTSSQNPNGYTFNSPNHSGSSYRFGTYGYYSGLSSTLSIENTSTAGSGNISIACNGSFEIFAPTSILIDTAGEIVSFAVYKGTSGSFTGGLNVGSAIGATTGQVRAHELYLGTGSDVRLYRGASDTLRTPDAFTVDDVLTASNGINAAGAFQSQLVVGGPSAAGFAGSIAFRRGSAGAAISAYVGFSGASEAANFESRVTGGGSFFSWSANVTGVGQAEVMRMSNAGRLGIGTASPGYLLDVAGDVNGTGVYRRSGTQVVGARVTGWAAATGTATRTTFATGTVTTAQLAERVKALIDDLTTHGLIGA